MALDVRSSQMAEEETYLFAYSLAGAKWSRKPGSHAVMDYYNDIIDHTGFCYLRCPRSHTVQRTLHSRVRSALRGEETSRLFLPKKFRCSVSNA